MTNGTAAFDKKTYSLEANPLEDSHEPTPLVPPQDEGWKAWIFLAAAAIILFSSWGWLKISFRARR